MYSEDELKSFYDAVLIPAVTLNGQWLLNNGDFVNVKPLIEARERLRAVCNSLNLDMVILPDGDDAVLVIKTLDGDLVLQIVMNKLTWADQEEV